MGVLNHVDPEAHNREQRSYFERTVKRTMVPRDSRYLQRHVDEALRVGSILAGDRVLEVGCGMGRYTLILAEKGLRVEGIDLSPVMLDRLQEYNQGRFEIPLHCSDIWNHPVELDGQFDGLIGFFTLHHLHNLSQCFEAMARLLKARGKIVFVEPNPLNLMYYIQILITPGMTWEGDKGILGMRPRLIFSAMEKAGFHHLSLARFGFFPPFLADRSWGSRLEAFLERVPIWRVFLPFQIFKGEKK